MSGAGRAAAPSSAAANAAAISDRNITGWLGLTNRGGGTLLKDAARAARKVGP